MGFISQQRKYSVMTFVLSRYSQKRHRYSIEDNDLVATTLSHQEKRQDEPSSFSSIHEKSPNQ